MLVCFLLLPSLLLASHSPLTFSYSVEHPQLGLSFGQQQRLEGGELVGSYRAALPGRGARQLHHGGARAHYPGGPRNNLHTSQGGLYKYSIRYRL